MLGVVGIYGVIACMRSPEIALSQGARRATADVAATRFSLLGGAYLPIVPLQVGRAFLLFGLGGITSVIAASSRTYARGGGPTTLLAVSLVLNGFAAVTLGLDGPAHPPGPAEDESLRCTRLAEPRILLPWSSRWG